MKLRIRFEKEKDTVIVQEDIPLLVHLREAIRCKFNLHADFHLSLNGNDVLQSEESYPLAELGIVNGDMIFVLESTSVESTERHIKDPSLLKQLLDMGFPKQDIQAVLKVTDCSTIDEVLENLLEQQGSSSGVAEKSSSDINQFTSSGEKFSSNLNKTPAESSAIQTASENITSDEMKLSSTEVTNILAPIICHDGIPQLLEKMYFESSVSTLHDALCVVLRVIMLETGFQVSEENSRKQSTKCFPVPVQVHDLGMNKLLYCHSNCPGLHIVVSLTSIGNFIMMHGYISDIEDGEIYQSKICVTDFVKSNVSLGQGPACVYQNLHKLSRLIKDQIALPLISTSRSYLGLPDLHGLMALPPEVKLKIFLMLDITSVLKLSEVCKELHLLLDDKNIWKHLLQRDFKKANSDDYKKDYINFYKERQKLIYSPYFFPHPGHPSTFDPLRPIPTPHFPPGIIGGSHDLHPVFPYIPGGIHPSFPPRPHPSNDPLLPRPRFYPFRPQLDDMETRQADRSLRPGVQSFQRHSSGTRGYFPRFL